MVAATGLPLRERVERDGFEWRELTLGRGTNLGVSRPEAQAGAEADHLRGFFAATRVGAIETLLYQAERRADDLLWQPEAVARQLAPILDALQPDRVITDHVSLTATTALRGLGEPFDTFVPGHPSQLPVGNERYGAPPAWPAALLPSGFERARLLDRCRTVTERIADQFNAAVRAIGAGAADVDDPFRVHGERVLYNYPEALHDPTRARSLPAGASFLGSCVRDEDLPRQLENAVADLGVRSFVYVSFGTFLSQRDDVLAVVADGLRAAGVVAAIATGPTPSSRLGLLPASWIVAPELPQVALLRHASVMITHAGNNSVGEAIRAGVPMLALPFSTDQFAIAADLERLGVGRCLDPNALSRSLVSDCVAGLTAGPERAAVRQLAETLSAPFDE